jgi:hypothetical protein
MCIVVEEADVCSTNIFVAPDTKKERQIVVYSNTVDTSFEKNLMVLALPNPETVDFVNLSEYPEFFKDVKKYFKKHEIMTKSVDASYGMSKSFNGSSLKVHEVGNFLASICKNIDDLNKINSETFGKIGNDALEFMKSKYLSTNYGFVVCKLKKGNNNYHPFAYTHKIDNNKLFVPTMHYHGDEKKRIEQELKTRKEYSENGMKNELKTFEFFKKVNGSFYSDEVYQNKLDNIMNMYKNKEIVLDYNWDHNIYTVNNEHDHNKYEKKLDQLMFKKKVNFDIGKINAISKITKIGKYSNGDTIISVKN